MGAPWPPKTTPKRTKHKCFARVFCTPISEGILARIVAETGPKLHGRNNVWTAPARADRMLAVLRKTCPGTTFFKRFWRRFGCQIEQLGSPCGHDGTFFRRWVRCRCRGYGNHWKPRQPHIKSEGKVYLSDKTYD